MSAADDALAPRDAQIRVDADACPNVIKDILFRAADRARVNMTLVANQWIRTPASALRALDPGAGRLQRRRRRDRQPLAALALVKGALGLNTRGVLYTPETIAQRLSMRNVMDELRGARVNTGGPPTLDTRDRQAFANELDRWLVQRAAANAQRPA